MTVDNCPVKFTPAHLTLRNPFRNRSR